MAKIFPFQNTETKNVLFEKMFKYRNEPDATNLKNASMFRDEVVNAYKMDVPAESKAMVLERYMPYLFSFVTILERCPKLKTNKPLNFTWSTVLHRKGVVPVEITSIRFELVMIIFNYGLAKSNHARYLVNQPGEIDKEEVYKMAAKLLREGAGVLNYLFTMQLPHWTDLPKDRPPEVLGGVSNSLSQLFCAEAQLLAIAKLEAKGGKPKNLAKLYIGTKRMFEASDKALRKMTNDYSNILDPMKTYVKLEQELCYSKACRLLATQAYSENKYGLAVGFIREAVSHLKPILNNKMLSTLIQEEKEIIKECKTLYERDNDQIYFEHVPIGGELEAEIPEGVSMMNPIEWNPPPPAFTSLEIMKEKS